MKSCNPKQGDLPAKTVCSFSVDIYYIFLAISKFFFKNSLLIIFWVFFFPFTQLSSSFCFSLLKIGQRVCIYVFIHIHIGTFVYVFYESNCIHLQLGLFFYLFFLKVFHFQTLQSSSHLLMLLHRFSSRQQRQLKRKVG